MTKKICILILMVTFSGLNAPPALALPSLSRILKPSTALPYVMELPANDIAFRKRVIAEFSPYLNLRFTVIVRDQKQPSSIIRSINELEETPTPLL
jgi:hypothetical protein